MFNDYRADVLRIFTTGHAAVRNANWASLLFSTTPISGAFSKWPVRIYFMLVSLLLLFQVFGPDGIFGLMLSRNTFTGTHFRLHVWKLREADASALDPAGLGTQWGMGALGLARDGCALEVRGAQEARGSHLYLSFDEQVTANGFSFLTLPSANSQNLDAVGFDLAYCQNDGDIAVLLPWQCPEDKWRVVGSSDCRFSLYSMSCYPVPNWIFKTALSRDYMHSFDLSGPWYHGLCNVLRHLISCVGFISACGWSVLGELNRARVHLGIVTFVLNGLVNGVLLGCAHLLNGPHPTVGWLPLITGVNYIYIGCTIVWQVSLSLFLSLSLSFCLSLSLSLFSLSLFFLFSLTFFLSLSVSLSLSLSVSRCLFVCVCLSLSLSLSLSPSLSFLHSLSLSLSLSLPQLRHRMAGIYICICMYVRVCIHIYINSYISISSVSLCDMTHSYVT